MQNSTLFIRFGFLPLALLLLLSSCATQYYQLRPVSGEVAQIDGRAVTKAAADSLEVVASFEREDMEYMALDVELKNRTDHALDIDPSNFRMVSLDANKQPIVTPGMVDFRQAADPDYESGKMGYKIQREENRLKRAKIMNTVLAVAVVAASVAAATSSSPRSRNGREVANYINTQNNLALAYNALQVKRVIDHTSFADRMQRLDFEAYRWRNLALKRSVVQPGQSVRGYVYLPKSKDAAFLNLTYPMPSGSAVEILFQQNLTKQRPN
ncbi:hypothetical protein [Fibrella aquatilis]|uniref:Uncharacterized protein n=1 Tax=Fibrella aquatilis TaxID=2817059 RepID=A0A939G7K9_9BACT|nr:hypothetical protein [Fibrella aquatilis]MBO0931845.1 hypothetical protein [Fibrella aquatilis]